MEISAEGALDPHIGGINFKISANLILGSKKSNVTLGVFMSGNPKNERAIQTGIFGGLFYNRNGISVSQSFCQDDFVVTTTNTLHLNLLEGEMSNLNATIYKNYIRIGNTGLQTETIGGTLSFNEFVGNLTIQANSAIGGGMNCFVLGLYIQVI